jgi:TolB-like protein/Flp pilus assembly protein TadD
VDSVARDSPALDAPRPAGDDRLDSWKEIAAYLKRSVRTSRRWEAEEHLPVHRHLHRNSGTVYAFKRELDVWLASRTSRLAAAPDVEESSSAPASPSTPSFRRTVSRPVLTGALLVAVVLTCARLWSVRSVLHAKPPAIRSLAVLPLANLTSDPSQAYLADGLTDALITELARMSDVLVISRTSVMQYRKASSKRLPDIARELKVDAVVEGTIARSGSRLRLAAELLDGRSERRLWVRNYDRDVNDLAGLPHEVGQAIRGAVAGRLVSRSDERRQEPRRVDPDAYQLFLKSLIAASAQTYDGFQDAIAYCQQAIEKDPAFAAAYARMSLFYLQFSFFGTLAPKSFMPQAEAAARRAIDLDDTLPESHAVLGAVLYRFRWEWSHGETEFKRALALNPSYAEGHRMLSAFLTAVGRADEAVAEARRALELDPRWLQARLNLGMAFRAAGQFDAAIEEFRYTLQKDPNRARAHFQLGNAYVDKGMLRDGIAEFERAVALSEGNPIFLSSLAYGYARSGRTDKTRKILADLEAIAGRQYVPPTAIARLYVALHDTPSAHAWIEKAYLERDLDLIATNADLGLSELRSDPSFQDVFSRLGLVR